MAEPLSTNYTKTAEGRYLAYQVTGDGPTDLVIPVTGSAAAELIWYEPAFSRFISRLASFSRLDHLRPEGLRKLRPPGRRRGSRGADLEGRHHLRS